MKFSNEMNRSKQILNRYISLMKRHEKSLRQQNDVVGALTVAEARRGIEGIRFPRKAAEK